MTLIDIVIQVSVRTHSICLCLNFSAANFFHEAVYVDYVAIGLFVCLLVEHTRAVHKWAEDVDMRSC